MGTPGGAESPAQSPRRGKPQTGTIRDPSHRKAAPATRCRRGAFRRELIPQLRACATGGVTAIFLVSSLLPSFWPPNMSSPIADHLFEVAADILSRRSHLGLDATCLAATYRQACIRHVDLQDHHRPGPRQQAQQLLQALGESS